MVPRLWALLLLFAACKSTGKEPGEGETFVHAAVPPAPSGEVVRTSRGAAFAEVLEDLAEADVVYIAGRPGDPAHHEIQLVILEYLAENGGDECRLHAIGLDIFERGSQAALDDFVYGRIGEAEMLARTGIEQRSDVSFDPYRPVLALARARRLPVLALGVEGGIRAAVASGGLDALTPEQRLRLPAISPTAADPGDLVRQVEIEVAADVIVEWRRTAAPENAQLVVLAAPARVAPRAALPERLFARTGKQYRTVVARPERKEDADPRLSDRSYADYLWFTGGG